ncbi:MAG: cheW 2 [Firmicutes bacterium]|nr:cheW 2 [Bacillota bacterium]
MASDVQLVIFKLANEDYGLPISKVQEINRMVAVTKLPNSPEFMEGIINLRGRIIPVLDLRKRFGFNTREYQEDTRIIVVDISGQTVGLIVDAVHEVAKIQGDCIEPPPPTFVIDSQFVQGIGKLDGTLVIILDIDHIIT